MGEIVVKISVSMYSLVSLVREKNWTIKEFIKYAKDISLDGVELLDIFWESKGNKEQEIKETVELLKEHDLVVSAYDISNNFVKETREKWNHEVEKVYEGIRIAKRLETNVVRVFSGDLTEDGMSYEDAQALIVEGLSKGAKMAEEERVYLAIENHGLLAGKSEQVEEIIEKVDSPFVKSTFDTGNFLLVHEKPEDAFERLKDNIVHVHFKDFRKKKSYESMKGIVSIEGTELIGTIPGDGQVNLSYIVNGLQAIDYQGWLSIEYEGIEEPKSATKESVNRLKKLVK